MRYMLMICSDEKDDFALTPDDLTKVMGDYRSLIDELKAAGVYEASERLRPVADATTVRVRGGQVSVTDGPFAETKEQVGGFFLIEAKDLDDAIACAARIPSASHGSVEIRPIWEREDYMEGAS